MGEVGPPDDRISPRVIFQGSKKKTCIVELRGRGQSGRPRGPPSPRVGRGRGLCPRKPPAAPLCMTIKARRFTLAGLGLSDGAENKSGIAVYHPCITEQIVGVGNALILLVPARTR